MGIENNILRVLLFILLFSSFWYWETQSPRIKFSFDRNFILKNNFFIHLVNSFLIGVIPILSTVGFAKQVENWGVGFFNWVNLPAILSLIVTLVAMDFFIYWQHRYFHKNNFFWKFHAIHHSDISLQTSTALRFHFGEIIFSVIFKCLLILIFGFKAQDVLLFEVLLNSMAMFNHSNIDISEKWNQKIMKFFVTPDMHRVHHSTVHDQHNSNFGFNFSFWDKIFKSYKEIAYKDQEKIEIGLSDYRSLDEQTFKKLLKRPFQKELAAKG